MDLSEASDDGDKQDDTVTSPVRKRGRRGRKSKHNKQNMVDFWPAGGSFNQENIPVEELEDDGHMKLRIQDPIDLVAEVDQVSSVDTPTVTIQSNERVHGLANEAYPASGTEVNTGNAQSANESTAAGSQVPSKFKKDIRGSIPKHPEMRMGGQETSTGLALARLEGFLHRLSGLNPHDNHPEFRYAEQEVQKARVDYNYCLYYPSNKEWRPPPSSDKRDLARAKSMTKPKQWRAALWRLVEKSMKSGRLESIKDGSLVAAEISKDISDSVESISPESNKPTSEDDGELSQGEIVESRESSLGSLSGSPEQMMINVSDGKATVIAGTKADSPTPEKTEVASVSHIKAIGSPEEGELDDDASLPDNHDAMMDYSDSAQLKEETSGPQQLDGTMDSQRKGLTLKNLTSEMLNKQLRYFHVGKLPEEVDLGLSVKCLTCGGGGHDSDNCETLVCSNCKAYNKHMTLWCPTKLNCSRCSSRDHQVSTCPYKLKLTSVEETTCDLCQLTGHVEEDCELMWRTSGRSWVLNTFDLAHTRLSCYECGNQGHLGNDCPTRRPGKGFGSSSWSMFRRFDVPLRSEQQHLHDSLPPKSYPSDKKGVEMKIKGRAKNNPPPPLPETLPDRDSFLRPKRIPEPVRRSVIHINTGTSQRLSEIPRPASLTSIHQPFGDYGPVKDGHRGASGQADARDSEFASYNHGNPMYDGDYDRPRRRSRSPPQHPGRRDYREDRYRPGPPPPRGGYRNENLYRPMPSAAQNAYNRHRM